MVYSCCKITCMKRPSDLIFVVGELRASESGLSWGNGATAMSPTCGNERPGFLLAQGSLWWQAAGSKWMEHDANGDYVWWRDACCIVQIDTCTENLCLCVIRSLRLHYQLTIAITRWTHTATHVPGPSQYHRRRHVYIIM